MQERVQGQDLINSTKKNSQQQDLVYEAHDGFVLVYLNDLKETDTLRPKRILVCDLDQTLVDTKESRLRGKPIIYPWTTDIVQAASKTPDTLLVCVTARPSPLSEPGQISTHPLSTLSLLNTCGSNQFKLVLFTNGKSKVPALNHLFSRFSITQRNAIFLLDDSSSNVSEALLAGFAGCVVDTAFSRVPHLSFLEKFLKSYIPFATPYSKNFSLFKKIELKPAISPHTPSLAHALCTLPAFASL